MYRFASLIISELGRANDTCHFVPDELGGLDVADAAEQAAQLVLAHALRQVVHDQVGSGVLVLHHLLAVAVIVQLLSSGGSFGSVPTISDITLRRLNLTHLQVPDVSSSERHGYESAGLLRPDPADSPRE